MKISNYICTCGRIFENKQSYSAHCGHCVSKGRKPHGAFGKDRKEPWNKGLTKETSAKIYESSLKNSKTKRGKKKKPLSDEHKRKISESMRIAHKEGRAHNIGSCRWNNTPSYPEEFFMRIIDNEFNDKNYIREHPFGKYSIDFAWLDKKKAIEIDGQQHENPDSIIHDKQKDEFIISNGWEVLRIKWKDMFNDTKKWIDISRNFIEN